MNILVPHSWLTEFVKTNAKPHKIAHLLSLHSASVERLRKADDDWIYDIEITTNRIDMASVSGLAREVAVVLNQNNIKAEYHPLLVKEIATPVDTLPVSIENDPNLCLRVMAVIVSDVKIADSPKWIRERLEKSGIRSLNNLVDITNYVMLEIGHPTHVFDYDRIGTNKLIIRPSKKGEKITTFEGKSHTLAGEDIVIDDGTGNIIDLPGISGTKNSVVTKDTTRVLFFIENNDPYRIRRTCMSLGIHTYASNINKNRPDSKLAKTALARGTQLYQQIANGTIASKIIDQYEKPKVIKPVIVLNKKIETYLGFSLSYTKVSSMLKPLGFTIVKSANGYLVTPPTWRQNDISIEEDIIEELARLYGYHNIISKVCIGEPVDKHQTNSYYWITKTKHALKYWGFTETYTSSLISSKLLGTYGFEHKKCIFLKNPLTEDGAYMRPSLIPGLLDTVYQNKYRSDTLRFFELSRVYLKNPKPEHKPIYEPLMLTFVINEPNTTQAFYTAKGIVESLLDELGINGYELNAEVNKSCPIANLLHPKRQAEIRVNDRAVGLIGQVESFILVDLDFDQLIKSSSAKKTFTPIPEYPPVIEDVTISVKEDTFVGPIIEMIKQPSNLVCDVALIDQFKNKLTFRITFQDPKKNLSDKEIGEIKKNILKSIK